MPHTCFDFYRQDMQHEFEHIDQKINKFGFKVDDVNGIKIHCNCNALKSVDYLHEHQGNLTLIEFSDLARQHEQIMRKVESVKASQMDRSDIREFVKKLYRTIPEEMKNKYLGSIHIMNIMRNKLRDIPEWANAPKGKYFVIIAPILDDAPADKRAEIVRLIDKIRNDLTTSIPDDLFAGVSVIQLSSFIQQ